jgi:hypothetical protein
MHLLTEQTTKIACPVEIAFLYASNLERFGEWFPGVIAIESANPLAHGMPGKEYLETVAVPLRGTRKIKLTVKEVEHNKRLVTEGAFPPLLPRMEIQFRALGTDACEVTWRMLSRSNSLMGRLTLVPLARNIMKKRAVVGVARLKERLETK